MSVLRSLSNAGFESYLVGGGVRDLLAGFHPKDFDIATAAEPEQVKQLFRRCRLIGRRFRLAHVRVGRDVVEVATFRAGPSRELERHINERGLIVADNVFGTVEEDARRRDFTVNSLYYDPLDETIVDFVGGMEDLERRVIRMIGDAELRYREDPVRILRAIRLSAKLGFDIDPDTEAPIPKLAPLLAEMPPARLFDEVVKLFMTGHAERSFDRLCEFGVFAELFPGIAEHLADETAARFVRRAFANTDRRLAESKPVTPGFLFAALLWPALRARLGRLAEEGMSPLQAIEAASGEVVERLVRRIALPRRFSIMAREIWSMQPRLERPHRRHALQLLGRQRFRAAYDFLLLRAEAGEEQFGEVGTWWTELQEANPSDRQEAVERLPVSRRHYRRRRRRAG